MDHVNSSLHFRDPHSYQPTPLQNEIIDRISINGTLTPRLKTVLTPQAQAFLIKLHQHFESKRIALLGERQVIQDQIHHRMTPHFLPETRDIRRADWTAAPIPNDLLDRRVEITGPPDRKMVINALNSGAQVYMADFEDSHSPTWIGTLEGQINLMEAIRGTLTYDSPEGKHYTLNSTPATLVMRPRGWHLVEKNVLVNHEPISASLFDFGLYFFHNAEALLQKGSGPYFYLPKIEHHLEARLWNDVFNFAQAELSLPRGTIRATVLIETLPASFQMDEIIYELRDHCAGLNCGRWDYIFSFIKKFSSFPDFVLPNRTEITMSQHFLNSYCKLLIQTCHRRQIHAMGGMAAQIPIKSDPRANAESMAKVVSDKTREVELGHDGTWVAHPGLVPIAAQVFEERLLGPHQIHLSKGHLEVTSRDLLRVPFGNINHDGLKTNIQVCLHYLHSWLDGKGCVPIHHLMEDLATAEISRAQVWQWIKHRKFEKTEFKQLLKNELQDSMRLQPSSSNHLQLAAEILDDIVSKDEFVEFLTIPAYAYL